MNYRIHLSNKKLKNIFSEENKNFLQYFRRYKEKILREQNHEKQLVENNFSK